MISLVTIEIYYSRNLSHLELGLQEDLAQNLLSFIIIEIIGLVKEFRKSQATFKLSNAFSK